MTAAAPALFSPLALRGLTLRNRIALSPLCQYVAEDGFLGGWHQEHHARFAAGGLGLAFTEATAVSSEGRITHGCAGLWDDAQIDAHRRIAERHRRHGVVPAIQLAHAGRRASTTRPWEGNAPLRATDGPEPLWERVGPSALPQTPQTPTPRALDEAGIARLIDAFAAAARRALAAGYAVAEVHGAHGYLLHSFLSPVANRRDDRWGGDARRRMAFPLAVAEAVRAVWPDDLPVFYRVSAVDGAEGGLEIADVVAFARELGRIGIDVVDCSSGGIARSSTHHGGRLAPGFQTPYARAIRDGAGVATMAVGAIFDPRQAEAIVAEGMADIVALGRQLMAEPHWPYRAALSLGHPAPHDVLAPNYGFYLARRAATLDLSPPAEPWPGALSRGPRNAGDGPDAASASAPAAPRTTA